MNKSQLLREVILTKIWSQGPVGMTSIMNEVRYQVGRGVEDWRVAAMLNTYIKKNYIRLYEDGKSFDVGTVRPSHLN